MVLLKESLYFSSDFRVSFKIIADTVTGGYSAVCSGLVFDFVLVAAF